MKHDSLNGVMIDVRKIKQHPDNPRKDLGDLEELTESIRKNGIMQNLTVIPEDEDDESNDNYIALIGHRRLAAAKEAHIFDVPCNIVFGLSKKEQVGIMLEENMQRSDLTPVEQAFGFQMMLDLGETEESIAEKTGFSRTTIHHRLQIAKLDKQILKRADEFQLSIGDLMALEQIKSIARRNAVLQLATSSEELRSKAAWEAQSEKREAQEAKLTGMLEEKGISRLPKNLESKIWTSDLSSIKSYNLDKLPDEIDLDPEMTDGKMYWYPRYGGEITIYVKTNKTKSEPTEYEIREKERKQNKEVLQGILKRMEDQRRTHVNAMLSGTAKQVEDTKENWNDLMTNLFSRQRYVSTSDDGVRTFLSGKHDWQLSQEEKDHWKNIIDGMRNIDKMLAVLEDSAQGKTTYDYRLQYNREEAEQIKAWNAFLEPYGFVIRDEEIIKTLDGTHELYEEAKDE